MKPLVFFSAMAVACAGGLLAVSYQGWQDEPSALSGLAQQQEPEQKTAVATPEPKQETAVEEAVEEKTAAKPETVEAEAEPTEAEAKPEPAETTPEKTAPAEAATTEAVPEKTAPAKAAAAEIDIARFEGDGSAVIAGRAEPGSKITVLMDGEKIGQTDVTERGEWVFVPADAFAKGAHSIEIEQTTPSGETIRSQQSLALTVPEDEDGKALIVLSETAKPSKVLQKPEPKAEEEQEQAEQKTAAVEKPSTAETEVKAVETQQAVRPSAKDEETEPKAEAAEQPAVKAPTRAAPKQNLTVEVVDYDEQGRTTFSGKSQPGSTVRVYVDGVYSGEAVARDDGVWAMAAQTPIKPGSHSLRTDQVASDGKVTERIELPFFRESGERIADLQAQRKQAEATKAPEPVEEAAEKPEPATSDNEPKDAEPEPQQVAKAERPQAKETEQTAAAEKSEESQQDRVRPQPAPKTEQPAAETPAEEKQEAVAPKAPQPAAQQPVAEQPKTEEVEAEQPKPSTEVASAPEPQQPAVTEEAKESEQPKTAEIEKPRTGRVVIQPGNNLWQISRVIYGKGRQYTVIYEANKDQIRDPNRIFPGQIFETPGSDAPESIDPKCRLPLAECE